MNFNLSLFSSTKEHTFKPLLASNIPIRARTQHDDTMRYDQPAKSQLDKVNRQWVITKRFSSCHCQTLKGFTG